MQASLPRKLPKGAKPQRQGTVWILRSPQGWLLERRPEKGLLGGMPGWPGDGWDGAGGPAPADADWQDLGAIRHVFTHFDLSLRVMLGIGSHNPLRGEIVPDAAFDPGSLPTVMRKAHALAAAALSPR